MKILSAPQIRAADAYTIAHEPVSGLLLMERAAAACADWIMDRYAGSARPFYIFCGPGNNGGDGLVIARRLAEKGFSVYAWLVAAGNPSPDNLANQARVPFLQTIHAPADFPQMEEPGVIIDALFGTGLNRPLDGWVAGVIHQINDQRGRQEIIAIDMPSGLMADKSSKGYTCIHARYTLTFEYWKLALLMPENGGFAGETVLIPIGLHPAYSAAVQTEYHLTDMEMLRTVYRPRDPFAHKGTYGHALLVAGSYGKMGAAVLSARAVMRAGAGLLTVHIPRCGYEIMQTAFPEAMCETEELALHSAHFDEPFRLRRAPDYDVIGIGPGIGTDPSTAKALERLLGHWQGPMVLDADALNILSKWPSLMPLVPKHSILTPHPREFERLFGSTGDQFGRLALLRAKAAEWQWYILLKGRFTAMACPDGSVFFNPTGNPGMATAGSGDVLTGILTGLLAQGYAPKAALILGAWLHGKAGDLAASVSPASLIASDIIARLANAFAEIQQ
ncbi:NAD(P)H-hydrate dehydratase [Chitinophaga sp.]|uniref:NAD(P)H-hydrate dehydratase n=1 Tax=Chitinophaga sp. TaxID=1869181 RepID=UPI00260DD42D|nr:NAD(P)H-hydrate dehydratase [uncultured Chitinophaga sp.]